MILITAYDGPDLDGSACAFAYAELLNKTGQRTQAEIFGMPHREAQFIFDYLKLIPNKGEIILKKTDKVILTDAS